MTVHATGCLIGQAGTFDAQWRYCPGCGAPLQGQLVLKADSLVLFSEEFPVIIEATLEDGRDVAFRARGDMARIDHTGSDREILSTLWTGHYDGCLSEDPLALLGDWLPSASNLRAAVSR